MCTRPTKAFEEKEAGLRPCFDFSRALKEGLRPIELPCGTCPECCKDYYTQWATRGSRELMEWPHSVFITLTYDNKHLPKDKSLDKRDLQLFIKRVKKHFGSTKSNPIRQIYCGEYGTQTNRPHYHAILFNCEFNDKKFHRRTEQNHNVYTSATLTTLWGKGFAEFGEAQPSSVAYLFKYILKKKSRKEKRKPHFIEVDGITYEVAHEFIESSRNPGIGAFMRDSQSLKKGYLIVDGVKKKLPKYYMEALKKTSPEHYEKIKDQRFDFVQSQPKETTLRKQQKEYAQKKLTDTKRKL